MIIIQAALLTAITIFIVTLLGAYVTTSVSTARNFKSVSIKALVATCVLTIAYSVAVFIERFGFYA